MASEGASGADRSDNDKSSDQSSRAERAESDLSDRSREALSGGEAEGDPGATAEDRAASQERMAAMDRPAKDRLEAETRSPHAQEEAAGTVTEPGSGPEVDPADDPDTLDRAAGGLDTFEGTPEDRAQVAEISQEMNAALTEWGEYGDRHFGAEAPAERGMVVGDIINDAPEHLQPDLARAAVGMVDQAAKYGDAAITEETLDAIGTMLTGEAAGAAFEAARAEAELDPDYAFADIEGRAQEVVAQSRTDPAGAQAALADLEALEFNGERYAAAVQELATQELVANERLLDGATFTPQNAAMIVDGAAALLDRHTHDGVVDLETLGASIEDLAATSPSAAVAVRAEIAARLSPAEAANLNRQLSGDWTLAEALELGWENPGQAAIGFGKGAVNVVTGTGELVANTLNRADALVHDGLGAAFDLAGWEQWAEAQYGLADHYRDVRLERDWTLDAANGAQQAGLHGAVVAEVAAAGYGLARMGVTGAGRLADEALDAAALARTVPETPAARALESVVAARAVTNPQWSRTEVLGRTVYQRDGLIDPDLVDDRTGLTNRELMAEGNAPIGPDGLPINLHHSTQTEPGPLVEIPGEFHRQNHRVLHQYTNQWDPTWVTPSGQRLTYGSYPGPIDRVAFDQYRAQYWTQRTLDFPE